MLHFIDTFSNMRTCFPEGKFSLPDWQRYAAEIAGELPEKVAKCAAGYSYESNVLPVVQGVYENWPLLEVAHASFQSAAARIILQYPKFFQTDLDVTTVFYLGLCCGAGWATSLGGKPAVLLGAEKILELKWHDPDRMYALIAHEIGHLWHQAMGGAFGQAHTVEERAIFQLFSEGIAIWFEQCLYGRDDFFLENHDGWLDWCQAHDREIRREYERRVQHEESVQDFFGDWMRYQGYSDVGYSLGTQLVRWLLTQHPIEELTPMSIPSLREAYHIFAES